MKWGLNCKGHFVSRRWGKEEQDKQRQLHTSEKLSAAGIHNHLFSMWLFVVQSSRKPEKRTGKITSLSLFCQLDATKFEKLEHCCAESLLLGEGDVAA